MFSNDLLIIFSVDLEAFQLVNILLKTAFNKILSLNFLSVKPENVTECKATPPACSLTWMVDELIGQ